MKDKYLYITDSNWFESTALSNPLSFMDEKLKAIYPKFYKADYDLKLLAAKEPTKTERESPIYNDYLDKFGSPHIDNLKKAALSQPATSILLCGFFQEHLDYLIPYIKESVEILYLHKCPTIKDLSCLSRCKKLKCLLIYWNNNLETLWDMHKNKNLVALSFDNVVKLNNVDFLLQSGIEYFSVDTTTINGSVKECQIHDTSIFNKMTKLQHLKLVYSNLKIDY